MTDNEKAKLFDLIASTMISGEFLLPLGISEFYQVSSANSEKFIEFVNKLESLKQQNISFL